MIIDYDKDQLAYALASAIKERDEARHDFEEQSEVVRNLKVALMEVSKLTRILKQDLGEARRELNEIRAERDLARLSSMESDQVHDRMVGELEKVYKERDEAREDSKKWKKLHDTKDELFKKGIAEVERERDELLQWKKGMLLVESQLDEQAVGRLLGLQLGESIKPNIEPKLRQLIRERDEAQEISEAFSALAWKLEGERNEAREELEEEKKFHNRTHSELVQTQCKLMDLTKTIIDTLEENRHLADGDDCTLAKLKSVVPDWK